MKVNDVIRLMTREDLKPFLKEEEPEDNLGGAGGYYHYSKRKRIIWYPYSILGREFRIREIEKSDSLCLVNSGWTICLEHCYTGSELPDDLFEV